MLFQFLSNVAHLAVKCIQKTETHQPEESRIIFEQIKVELIINHIDVLQDAERKISPFNADAVRFSTKGKK